MSIKVRHRPPVFDAIQWDGTDDGAEKIAKWAGDQYARPYDRVDWYDSNARCDKRALVIYMGSYKTGACRLLAGWWFIKGEDSFKSPISDEQFRKQYEEMGVSNNIHESHLRGLHDITKNFRCHECAAIQPEVLSKECKNNDDVKASRRADAERWRKFMRLTASPRVETICFIDLTADEYQQFKAWAESIGYKFAFERQGLQKVLEYLEQQIDSEKER